MSKKDLVLCYNRGCGQQYDPSENKSDSCRHHSGVPVFHDAYKGWSCCKKKCTDFTEFLNIKGCTVSFHSNVKPPEPPKPEVDKSISENEVIEYTALKPIVASLERPPFDTPLIDLKLEVSSSLKEQLKSLKNSEEDKDSENGLSDKEIPIGTQCKNNSCKTTYEGRETLTTTCLYHPGYPVFHEGLKFWSCCTKRTTDFDVFLNQVGCTTGNHVWRKEKKTSEVNCRLDWHQTASHVYVSIFGKKCDPDSSKVQLSPIRLKISLYFPEQGGAFVKDMELRGIVAVEDSMVTMTPTKVEIKLKKKEAGSWSKLDFPRQQSVQDTKDTKENNSCLSNITSQVESVDLSCI
ncbi:hypothetical protein O3M35_008170 [Rhynocoris fuscipes]|uniref:Cysteine and histidine-rich domain-containing protein 1 n=1 Tax=Rhynocoris fuscipes TaxID=488301 RepID=A0AAW1D858_9HEMI